MRTIQSANEAFLANANKIKEFYKTFGEKIAKATEGDPRRWYDIYACGIDWISFMSPIELYTWESLRFQGTAPFYPQFAVDKYFADFANPYFKLIIECDGAEYHNKHKDAERDADLADMGWTVFRISGADCNRNVRREYNTKHDYKDRIRNSLTSEYMYSTVEGLIRSLSIVYFGLDLSESDKEEYAIAMRNLYDRATVNKNEVFNFGARALQRGTLLFKDYIY